MHLQVLLFLIDTKLDLVRITFTLNIWRLQSEEKKKWLSQLFTAMPSINNQQYWKKNSCRFYYYSIPHPLSITITNWRYTKDWSMKQNSFSCVAQDICIHTKISHTINKRICTTRLTYKFSQKQPISSNPTQWEWCTWKMHQYALNFS